MNGAVFPQLLRTVDIRHRLITSFLLVSLIPLIICGAIFYVESSKAIEKKTGVFEAEVVRQVSQKIQLEMENSASSGETLALPSALQSRLADVFDGVNAGTDALVYVMDVNNGRIVARPTGDAADAGSPAGGIGRGDNLVEGTADADLISGIGRIVGSGGGSNFVSYKGHDGKDYLAAFALIPDTTLAVVSASPLQALIGEVRSMRNKIIIIGLVCLAFVLLLSYIICRSISVPLNRLVGCLKETESGNYGIRLGCEGKDEIAVLAKKFNEMAGILHGHKEKLDELVATRTRALRDANLKLEALSATDVLTGLANRRRLDDVLSSELRRAIRGGKYLSVIMLDVDFFKKYNDCYGHQAGDACLRKVAHALQSSCHRGGDLVARYGGEEFVLVAADTDMAGSMVLAETLRAAVEALRLQHTESEFGHVTISLGVAALMPAQDQTSDQLLQLADRAMYRAKLLGRNRVVTMDQHCPDTAAIRQGAVSG